MCALSVSCVCSVRQPAAVSKACGKRGAHRGWPVGPGGGGRVGAPGSLPQQIAFGGPLPRLQFCPLEAAGWPSHCVGRLKGLGWGCAAGPGRPLELGQLSLHREAEAEGGLGAGSAAQVGIGSGIRSWSLPKALGDRCFPASCWDVVSQPPDPLLPGPQVSGSQG